MKLILCTDERLGYSFNHRRQSSDLEMRRDMVRRLGSAADNIYVNIYTERSLLRDGFFSEEEAIRRRKAPAKSGRKFLEKAIRNDGWAFVENVDLKGCWHSIDEILLYIWDKRYPAEYELPAGMLESFIMVGQTQFSGHSHEVIRLEHYMRKRFDREGGNRL